MDGEAATMIASALRRRLAVSDICFDRMYAKALRSRSQDHWTPVDIALRACAWLAPAPGLRVLDVGSGVGKLCLVGALSTGASWVGIESDAEMIRAATDAARRLGVYGRARFIEGDATTYDWSQFDAIYMFNPFAEALLAGVAGRQQFLYNLESTQLKLSRLRPGARLVTYHGFGVERPLGFDLVHRESANEDRLCLWVRRGRRLSPSVGKADA